MFSRKQYDAKKHPHKGKGTKSPKPYRKEPVTEFIKEMEEDMQADSDFLSHFDDELDRFDSDWTL